MEINERVKMVRKHFCPNQTEFGKRIGLTQASVTFIENGKREVSEKHIKIICSEFRVNEDWLRTGEGDMISGEKAPDPDIIAFTDFLDPSMNPKKKKILGHIARTLDGMSDTDLQALCKILCGIADDIKDQE